MNLRDCLRDVAQAWRALDEHDAGLAARAVEHQFEALLVHHLKALAAIDTSFSRQLEARLGHPTSAKLEKVIDAYAALDVLTALERMTKRSTRALRAITLHECRNIRNDAAHGRTVEPADARLLIHAIEHLAELAGADLTALRLEGPDASPLRSTGMEDLAGILLSRLWKYQDLGGAQASWAVKESDALRGNLVRATAHPGLGIALFTTELAVEAFGAAAAPKVLEVVDWGLTQCSASAPFLLASTVEDRSSGAVTDTVDLRHSVALAILMARMDVYREHRSTIRELLLANVGEDGSWPAVLDSRRGDLPTTIYVVEFLAIEGASAQVADVLAAAKEWIVCSAVTGGGWSTGIFASTSWDRLWSTAYILPRLCAVKGEHRPEWAATLREAALVVLSEAGRVAYETELTRFRVEARVAAALSTSLKEGVLAPLHSERAEAWLRTWAKRFRQSAAGLPARECDLATATFAVRGLLHNKKIGDFGKRMLARQATA